MHKIPKPNMLNAFGIAHSKGIKIYQLCTVLGIGIEDMHAYLNAKCSTPVEVTIKVAKCLGVETRELSFEYGDACI